MSKRKRAIEPCPLGQTPAKLIVRVVDHVDKPVNGVKVYAVPTGGGDTLIHKTEPLYKHVKARKVPGRRAKLDGVAHFGKNVPPGKYNVSLYSEPGDKKTEVTVVANEKGRTRRKPHATLKLHALLMVLDADRDGEVDLKPLTATDHEEWTWGADGEGAVVMVKTRTYQEGDDVDERSKISFKWTGPADQQWGELEATLEVEPQDKLKIYSNKQWQANEGNCVFDDSADPLDLTEVLGAENSLQEKQQIDLWLEATDFPSSANDDGAEIKLSYEFKVGEGPTMSQTAKVRIAPWIMASDLDPTDTVYGAGPNPLTGYPQQLSNSVGAAGAHFDRLNPSAKPFARDTMKCGWIHGPHHQKVVIQKALDPQNYYNNLPNTVPGAGTFQFPAPPVPMDVEVWNSQDNGGNLLVSPPIAGYPLGRIILGSDGNQMVCRAEPFYARQRIQTPLAIDPTWLSVGHVDEILTFVPDARAAGNQDPWPWKMLLISPRLGYVLAYAASVNANNGGVNVNQLLITAQQVNDASRQAAEDWAALQARCQIQFGNLVHVGGGGAGGAQWGQVAGPRAYVADPAAPAGQDGRVVLWEAGGNYQVQSIDSFLARPWEQQQLFHETAFNLVQPRIDQARLTLRQGLGGHQQPALGEGYVVEIPVLLDLSDSIVTHTADSVNMLVLRTGDNTASCLVPKPFGPVCGGAYLFQSYLHKKLVTDMGLTANFINDWEYLHNHHGEVHCGTNQIPRLLPDNRAWWLREPP